MVLSELKAADWCAHLSDGRFSQPARSLGVQRAALAARRDAFAAEMRTHITRPNKNRALPRTLLSLLSRQCLVTVYARSTSSEIDLRTTRARVTAGGLNTVSVPSVHFIWSLIYSHARLGTFGTMRYDSSSRATNRVRQPAPCEACSVED